MTMGRHVIRRSPGRRNVHGTLGFNRAVNRTCRDLSFGGSHPLLRNRTITTNVIDRLCLSRGMYNFPVRGLDRIICCLGRCCPTFIFSYGSCSALCRLVARSGGGRTKVVGFALLSRINSIRVGRRIDGRGVLRSLSFCHRDFKMWQGVIAFTTMGRGQNMTRPN